MPPRLNLRGRAQARSTLVAATATGAEVGATLGSPAPAPAGWRRTTAELRYAVRTNRATAAGAAIVAGMVFVAVFAPLLQPYPPLEIDLDHVSEAPSLSHPLGTDQFGHDMLSRIIAGTRLDLTIALSASAIATILGLLIGCAAGFMGGWLDGLVMRTQDVLQSFPRFVFAMAVAFAIGPGLSTVILAVSVVNAPVFARLARGEIMRVKESDFAQAAIMAGNSRFRLLWRHLLPNTLVPVMALATLQAGLAILEAAGLSFIGLGIAVPEPEWGAMISLGLQDFLQGHWWIYTFPGLAISIAVLGFNLLGDGLQDILDPRRRES